MKYRPASCRAPIPAVRTRRGGETADPPTGALTQPAHTSCQYGLSGADSCGGQSLTVTSPFTLEFFFSSKHAWTHTNTHTQTHTHRARGRGRSSSSGAFKIKKKKSLSPCRGSLWGLAWHYWKIRLLSALLSDVIVGFTLSGWLVEAGPDGRHISLQTKCSGLQL